MIRVGVCGFPKKRAEIFAFFDVVEVQRTFYNFVSPEILLRLAREAPLHFTFTMKAFQGITHRVLSPTYRRAKLPPHFRLEGLGFFQETPEVEECALRTKEMAKVLGSRVIVFQCPPSFSPSPENVKNLTHFFERFPREGSILAWEPRGKWRKEEIREICKSLDLVHVVDPFVAEPQWGSIYYFRLHGRNSYRYFYSDEDLAFLCDLVRGVEREVFCLFNNVPMFENALAFKRMLAPSP
ncbi:MAG: DUF72 domain-containing protein [Candidatus Caldatribacteriaceae bacterium]